VKASPTTLENELLRVTFNRRGEITSLVDKGNQSEFAAASCNVFHLYKDVPSGFDAWDIDSMYKAQEVPLAGTAKVTMHASGLVLGSVRTARRIGNSHLEQEVILRSGSRRLDFRTRVDWQESHKLLKVNFPVTVRAEDALHEIQFGHVRRPTHASQVYDAARFEVSNHKWTALVEENRGAAILNDCKYGVNVEGNSINLTLLKSALAPDMTADKGMQEFTYAFYCWNGAFTDSGVIQASYELNVPATMAPGKAESGRLFAVSKPNVIIETVKPAEDGSGDVVVRMYGAARCSVTCDLRTSLPITEVVETNMLEETIRKVRSSAGKIALSFRPFEIKTLRFKVSQRARRKA
jgi:alpha-mannosidase